MQDISVKGEEGFTSAIFLLVLLHCRCHGALKPISCFSFFFSFLKENLT